MTDEGLGEHIYRVALFDEDDKPLATQTKEALDLRDAFLDYGIIVPKEVPRAVRDDLHSICLYYKAAQLRSPITLRQARQLTKEMSGRG